ncbi:triple tyrosine motif-containing protein [Halioglobus pacificus]|nr:triple tyrosine motif-containing protein [Halioglobus pacificus]
MTKARMFSFVSALLLLVCTLSVNARWSIHQLHPEKLTETSITSVVSDTDGKVWVGSLTGLQVLIAGKFYSTEIVDGLDPLFGRQIIRDIVQEDSGREIWILTETGYLARVDSDQLRVIDTPWFRNYADAKVLGILQGHDKIWLWGLGFLAAYDYELGGHVSFAWKSGDKLLDKPLLTLRELNDSVLYGLTQSSLLRIDLENFTVQEKVKALEFGEGTEFRDFHIGSKGGITVLTKNGRILEGINTLNSQRYSVSQTFSQKSADQLVVEPNHYIIGTDGGIAVVPRGKTQPLTELGKDNSELSNNHVLTISPLKGGYLIGTYRGLNYLSKGLFDGFNDQSHRLSNEVLNFTEDENKNIWIATYSGVFRFSKSSSALSTFSRLRGLPDERAMTIESIENDIWIGLREHGVVAAKSASIDKDQSEFKSYLPNKPIPAIRTIQDSQHVLLATLNEGLYILDKESRESFKADESPSRVTLISKRVKDYLYYGNEDALFVYWTKDGTSQRVSFNSGGHPIGTMVSLEWIQSGHYMIISTLDNGIWMAERLEEQPRSLALKRPPNNELAEAIACGVLEKENHYWFSTSDGIIVTNDRFETTHRFSLRDGLQSKSCNVGAVFKDSRDRLYFGGSNGFNVFEGSLPGAPVDPPKMMFERIHSAVFTADFVKSGNIPPHLELHYGDRSILLDFAVMEHFQADATRYRYRLQGYNDEWVESGSTSEVNYSALPPGNYIFHVQGSDSSGRWNREGLVLSFTVLKPWWLTTYAFAAYIVLAIAAAIMARRWYLRMAVQTMSRRMNAYISQQNDLLLEEVQDEIEIQEQILSKYNAHTTDLLTLVQQLVPPPNGGKSTPDRELSLSLLAFERNVEGFENDIHFDVESYTNELIDIHIDADQSLASRVICTVEISTLTQPAPYALRCALLIHYLIALAKRATPELSPAVALLNLSLSEPVITDTNRVGWVLRGSFTAEQGGSIAQWLTDQPWLEENLSDIAESLDVDHDAKCSDTLFALGCEFLRPEPLLR